VPVDGQQAEAKYGGMDELDAPSPPNKAGARITIDDSRSRSRYSRPVTAMTGPTIGRSKPKRPKFPRAQDSAKGQNPGCSLHVQTAIQRGFHAKPPVERAWVGLLATASRRNGDARLQIACRVSPPRGKNRCRAPIRAGSHPRRPRRPPSTGSRSPFRRRRRHPLGPPPRCP